MISFLPNIFSFHTTAPWITKCSQNFHTMSERIISRNSQPITLSERFALIQETFKKNKIAEKNKRKIRNGTSIELVRARSPAGRAAGNAGCADPKRQQYKAPMEESPFLMACGDNYLLQPRRPLQTIIVAFHHPHLHTSAPPTSIQSTHLIHTKNLLDKRLRHLPLPHNLHHHQTNPLSHR